MKKIKKITDLLPDSKNFNKHTNFGMSLLEKSMRQHGFMEAGVISEDGVIISGNARQEVANNIGLENVEIIETDGKRAIYLRAKGIKSGTKEFHELALKLNAVSHHNIEFDEAIMEEVLTEDIIEEWGLSKQAQATDDDFEVPPLEEIKTKIKLGDLFEIGQHRLLCGDSTNSDDVVKLMNGSKADILHCDPPYGVNYADKNKFLNQQDKGNRIQRPYASDKEEDYEAWFNSWLKLAPLNNYNSVYIWINEPKLFELLATMRLCEIKMSSLLIWVKNNHVLSRKDYHPKYEICLFGWKGKHKFYGDFNTSVLEYDKPLRNELHPTMKPAAMIAKLINNSSKIEQIVLELFLGSGTTMVAAHQLNRKCYGMEIDPKYCQVIIDRMLKLNPNIAIKRNGKDWKP